VGKDLAVFELVPDDKVAILVKDEEARGGGSVVDGTDE